MSLDSAKGTGLSGAFCLSGHHLSDKSITFVRFGSEAEQQHALGSMTGEMGLGSKPIKVWLQKSEQSFL